MISIVFKILIIIIMFMPYMSFASNNNTIIPRKVLFDNPDKASVFLSPDGKYISYLAPKEGVLNIWVGPSNDFSKIRPVTNDNDRGIRNYYWSFDGEHIIYAQDNKGDENFRLYSLALKSGEATLLTPATGIKASVYGISEKVPNALLIGMNNRDQRYFDIYKVNLKDNTKELVMENNKFSSFVVDDNLQIRFATFNNEDGSTEYFEFKNNKWLPFMHISLEDSANTGFIGFDNTGTIAYLLDSRENNTSVLKSLDLKTKKYQVLAEDKRADIDVFTVHPTKKNIQAVKVNYDKASYNIIDNSIKEDIEYLKSINSGEIIINSRTLDDKKWLIAYSSDIAPVQYYLYDRAAKKANFLFSNRKNLEQYKLANMEPVVIKARDGLNLVSYITFPTEAILKDKFSPSEPLPLVLLVHGGPWARDSWGLNPIHQWLANRGYAVLSVNFRGSTGFGKGFLNAGNREWGRKMHEDLIDAVNWTTMNKVADPKKIAIMGGSYGGYATLVGLTLTPDIFACGIDIVGPSNLLTLIKSVPPYWQPLITTFKERMGPWETPEDREKLKEVSPLTFADKIKKPLFIAQGKHDPRVKQEESDQIVEVMKNKNIPVMYALYEDEGHGFIKPGNRLSFYALAEQFLMKVLGGRAEVLGDDLKDANFVLNGKKVDNIECQHIIDHSIKIR